MAITKTKPFNKALYGEDVIIDMSDANISESSITADPTVNAGYKTTSPDIRNGKKAYGPSGAIATGNMTEYTNKTYTVTGTSPVSIDPGYYAGSGNTIQVDTTNLTANNIRKNTVILGITGTMDPAEGMNLQTDKTVTYTPRVTAQTTTVTYDSGHSPAYNGLSQVGVTINPIPYTIGDTAGTNGATFTIG
jgi:hypothetical protein